MTAGGNRDGGGGFTCRRCLVRGEESVRDNVALSFVFDNNCLIMV